jgi:UDP-N-acetylmuramate dehydrogenase
MAGLDNFAEITKRNAPLAPYTALRLGGPADYLMQPRSREELLAVARLCFTQKIPLRVLGGGYGILVREEGVRGVVLRLCEPAFMELTADQNYVKAGAGAALSDLISFAARQGLAGLEVLVGISGTVGAAVRSNAGDRAGEIGPLVHCVEVMDESGEVEIRERDEIRFGPHASNLDDPVTLSAQFELDADQPDAIVKRMRKAWIQRKATLPLTFQAHARLFRNPPGLEAATLIEQADLAKTQVGGAEISNRHANSVVVHPGGTANDVLKLIDLVRDRVQDRFGLKLELEITIW